MTEKVEAGLAPKQPSGIRTAAVLMIQTMVMGFGIITPAIAVLQTYWADNPLVAFLPVTLTSTLPTLTTMLGIVISGSLVGKVKPKTLAIWAAALFVVFGTLPYFFYSSYIFLLVCRAICGVGLGLMNPLANTIILGCYVGDKKASLLGYGTLMMNGGCMIMQTLSGVLAGIDTSGRLIFLVHLFGLFALVFAFMLPDPDMYEGEAQEQPAEVEEAEAAAKKKAKIPGSVWFVAVLVCLFNVFNYPTMLNCSTILMNSGVATESASFVASMALNCYTIFAMIAGALFGQLFKRAPRWTMPFGFACSCIGILLIVGIANVPAVCVGMSLVGGGYYIFFTSSFSWTGAVSDPNAYAKGISCIQTLKNLGGFIATYWLLLLQNTIGDSVYFAGYVLAAYCVIGAIVVFFYNPWKNQKAEAAEA